MKIGRSYYNGVTKLMVPWFDTEGNKQWSVMTFTGLVHRKRMWREARKMIKLNFNKRVRSAFLRSLPLVNTYDPNAVAKPMPVGPGNGHAWSDEFEAFLQRMHNEAEAGTDSDVSSANSQ